MSDFLVFLLMIGGLWIYSRLCMYACDWQYEDDEIVYVKHSPQDADQTNVHVANLITTSHYADCGFI